jgi:hypothetical protein
MFERMSAELKQLSTGMLAVDARMASAAETSQGPASFTLPTALDSTPVRSEQARRIDALLDQGGIWPVFPDDLEALFLQDNADKRLRWAIISGLAVSIVVNWLLLPDMLMVPDMFDLAVRLRLFAFTPMVLVGIFVLCRLSQPWMREWGVLLPGLLSSFTTALLSWLSQDSLSGPYLVSLIPVVVFANSVAHMRLWPAVVMDFFVVLMFGAVWLSKPDAPLPIMLPAALTLMSSITFTLYGCFILERDARRNWLLRQRETCLLV